MNVPAPEASADRRNARKPSLMEKIKHNGQVQSGERNPVVT
jgi:hypothetical protein